MRLEHINMTVSNLNESISLYSQVLGLKMRWQGHTVSGRPAAHVGTPSWYIAMFEGDEAEVNTTTSGRDSITLAWL